MSEVSTEEDASVEGMLEGKERFFAPIEVAAMFGIKQARIQTLCREGKAFPHAKKFGTMWRIPASDIRNYVDSSTDRYEKGKAK